MRLGNLNCVHIYTIFEPTFLFRYFDVITRHLADVCRGS